VPVFNSYRYLPESIDSIVAAIKSYENAELTIVDNGSTDGTWELLLSTYSDRANVLQAKGVTISSLRNRGAAQSSGEYLSFIDADCLVAPDYFDIAIAVFSATQADAAGSTHLLPDGPPWMEETWEKLHARHRDGVANYIPSGNFMVRKHAFDTVGGFDEALITGEDAEICQRLWKANFTVYSAGAIAAVHLGNPKTLMQFFRKEVWHGLGMFGTFHGGWLDKPVLMTFAHLLLSMGAILNLLLAPAPLALRLLFSLSLAILAPGATVAYRYAKAGRIYRPIRSLALYYLYLSARVLALFRIVERAALMRRPATERL